MRWVLPLLVVFLFAGVPAEANTEFVTARKAILDQRLKAYENLLLWCKNRLLLKEADRLAGLILEINPEHKRWRRWLGYKKSKEGVWERDPRRKLRKNWKPGSLPAYEKKRVELLGGLATKLRTLLAKHEHDLPDWEKRKTWGYILDFDPADDSLRVKNNEVKEGERWLLRESVEAAKHEDELNDRIRKLRAYTPAAGTSRISTADAALRVPWRSSLTVGPVRVVHTGSVLEAVEIARASYVMGELVAWILRIHTKKLPNPTVYVVRARKHYETAVRSCGMSAKDEKYYLGLSGCWLPGRKHTLLELNSDHEGNVDATARQTFGLALWVTLTNVHDRPGLEQGIGLYLTYLLLGTRLTTFVTQSRYADNAEGTGADIYESESDWLKIAAELDRRGHLPRLGAMLGTGLNAMTKEDLICSYALANYLFTGPIDKARRFLLAANKTKQVHGPARETLGYDLEGLDHRLRRWLREVTER